MSWQATAHVIKSSRMKGGALLALIVMANHASGDEAIVWASQETLARETRMSERQVRRIQNELIASGEIIELTRGRRGLRRVQIAGLGRADIMSGVDAFRPDISTTRPDIAVSGEPNVEPSRNLRVTKVGTGGVQGGTIATAERRSARAAAEDLWLVFSKRRRDRFGPAARHIDSRGRRAFLDRVPAAIARGCSIRDLERAVAKLADDDKQPSPYYLDDRASAVRAEREDREVFRRRLEAREEPRSSGLHPIAAAVS